MVVQRKADKGVLLCGTGVGMSIAANKIPGVYAAHCHEPETARMSRRHNNANVLTMGARVISPELAAEILDAWLESDFEGERHLRRLSKISDYEQKICPSCSLSEKGKTIVFDHPLVQHKVSIIRDKNTSVKEFRELVQEIAGLMVYEITRNLPLEKIQVETPLAVTEAYALEGKSSRSSLFSGQDSEWWTAYCSWSRTPRWDISASTAIRDADARGILLQAAGRHRRKGYPYTRPHACDGRVGLGCHQPCEIKRRKKVSLVCIIAAPEGVSKVHGEHPDVDIYTAALDSHLNDHGYIVPGLGDAGDGLFGTK